MPPSQAQPQGTRAIGMRILFYCRGVEQLGVEYVMAYAASRGHEVELLFDRGLDNNLYYRLDFLKLLNRWGRLFRKAVDFKPDLVAFAALSNVYPYAREFARQLKRHVDVPFVFGGIHPTALPDYVLRDDEVDYVIRGEGEQPLVELAEALKAGRSVEEIPNLGFKREGEIQLNPMRPLMRELDELPFPRREEFFREGTFRELAHVITARGCPFKCSYCVNNFYKEKLHKETPGPVPPVRRRSAANVIAEIRQMRERYPFRHIFFCDEVFIIKKKWLYEFLEMFADAFLPDVTFSFQYHHRFIDDEVAAALAKAGGQFGQGAIETADHDLRTNVLKRHDTDESIIRAMEIFRRHGIRTSTSAIFGIPHETPESRWKTVELVERSQPDMINTYLMYPFPGTEIAEIALRAGVLNESGFEKVKEGRSGYHQDSLFQNMDIDNAATMTKLLPLYIKGPKVLKPMVRRLMHKRIPRLAHATYIATAPLVYSGWARKWIGNLLRMTAYSVTGRTGPALQAGSGTKQERVSASG